MTVIALGLMLAASGCTATQPHVSATDDAVYAAVGPELAGTWRGTAFAVPGSSYLTSTAVQLDITPQGTWTWKAGGATKATGTVVRHGDQVVLQAGPAKGVMGSVAESVPLEWRGDHLWGVSRYFIPGAQSAVDLQRQGVTSGRPEPHS